MRQWRERRIDEGARDEPRVTAWGSQTMSEREERNSSVSLVCQESSEDRGDPGQAESLSFLTARPWACPGMAMIPITCIKTPFKPSQLSAGVLASAASSALVPYARSPAARRRPPSPVGTAPVRPWPVARLVLRCFSWSPIFGPSS